MRALASNARRSPRALTARVVTSAMIGLGMVGLGLGVLGPSSVAHAGADEFAPHDACSPDAGAWSGPDAGAWSGADAGGGYVFSDPVAAPAVRFEPTCSASAGHTGDLGLGALVALGAITLVTRRRRTGAMGTGATGTGATGTGAMGQRSTV